VTDDRITDGKRIAQLLASELSGLERGPLDAVSVGDADPDATPSERGTEAYRVTHRQDPIATVRLYPEHATVRLHGDRTWSTASAEAGSGGGLSVDGSDLQIGTGGAVKRAVDAVADLLDETVPVDDAETGE
jgi:hypothetical protein